MAERIYRAVDQSDEADLPRDVWWWTTPKYRTRTPLLLMVNAVLFAGLGCFTFWLRTGHYSPFSGGSYWQLWWEVFDPTNERQVTLIDFLTYPIPVDQVPLMMVIVGLILGSLAAIPILVAMLYRFPFSLIFTGIIGFVALLPWLAITVTFCCFMAVWKPLQFSFRYATALLALLPLVAYYALATGSAGGTGPLAPVEMAKLYLPWVMALISSCVLMGVVLTIAKIVNYRPGAIAPLLVVMFAIPMILFEVKVGRDELFYRILEAQYGPASTTHFVDHVDASATIRRIAEARLKQMDNPRATLGSVMDQVRFELQLQLGSIQAERDHQATGYSEAFAAQQYEAIQACDKFRASFPTSRYIPNVLYLEGQAIDARVDREFFRQKGILRYYRDFPNAVSTATWKQLHDEYSQSPLSSRAAYRLAILQARQNESPNAVDDAIKTLDELIVRFGKVNGEAPAKIEASGWKGFIAKRPASATLDVDPAAVALEGRKLRELLVNNRDPHQNDAPLRTLLSFNPRHKMYLNNLKQMLADIPTRYPLTKLRDNIELLITINQPSLSLRIQGIQTLVQKLGADPASDALPHARLELALAYQADNRNEDARAVFEDIQLKHAETPWAQEAGRRLATMSLAARGGG